MFPVDIFTFRRLPYNPFFHLRRPTHHMLPYHISSAALSIPIFPHIHNCTRQPLPPPLILSVIPIILHLRCVSVFVLPRLYCDPYRIIFRHYQSAKNGYLNQQLILFRLQYETHSLQMHTKSPCRSVFASTPKLLG